MAEANMVGKGGNTCKDIINWCKLNELYLFSFFLCGFHLFSLLHLTLILQKLLPMKEINTIDVHVCFILTYYVNNDLILPSISITYCSY